MKETKVYIGADGSAAVVCPYCGVVKKVHTEQFKNKSFIKARCGCKAVFGVKFEFRKHFRKQVSLAGTYAILPDRSFTFQVKIRDLSKEGIGFEVMGRSLPRPGDELWVEFTLDDAHRSEISRKVIVRNVRGRQVGCQFSEAELYDKKLGFYLMS